MRTARHRWWAGLRGGGAGVRSVDFRPSCRPFGKPRARHTEVPREQLTNDVRPAPLADEYAERFPQVIAHRDQPAGGGVAVALGHEITVGRGYPLTQTTQLVWLSTTRYGVVIHVVNHKIDGEEMPCPIRRCTSLVRTRPSGLPLSALPTGTRSASIGCSCAPWRHTCLPPQPSQPRTTGGRRLPPTNSPLPDLAQPAPPDRAEPCMPNPRVLRHLCDSSKKARV